MHYAFVTSNLIDLRGSPSHSSERVSQLFWGEPVEPLREEEGFTQVRQPDGYEGWIDCRFLAPMTADAYRRAVNEVDAVVQSTTADVFANTKGLLRPPYFLYFGTRLLTQPLKSGFVKAILPDKSLLYIRKHSIKALSKQMSVPATGASAAEEARRFLGVPYLWGGISPAGFDCSGLVRTVFSTFGVYLPRDTKDQVRAGRQVHRDEVRVGDLLFFERHVAIALDENLYIHSSRGGGGVRINSLDSSDPAFRSDLSDSFEQARRVL